MIDHIEKPDYARQQVDPVSVAVQTTELADEPKSDGSIVFSSGVVVKINARKLPVTYLQKTWNKINSLQPKPPIVHMPDKGRKEENQDDPDYIEAYNQWAIDSYEAIANVAVLRGVEIAAIPGNLLKPDSEEWLEEAGIYGAANNREAYLMWFNMCAAPTEADVSLFMERLGTILGASQQGVNAAANGFRS